MMNALFGPQQYKVHMLYILDDNRNVVQTDDPHVWADWFAHHDGGVAKTRLGLLHRTIVSTVFTGACLTLPGEAPHPFETCIFGGEFDMTVFEYATWNEASNGHKLAVRLLKEHKMHEYILHNRNAKLRESNEKLHKINP